MMWICSLVKSLSSILKSSMRVDLVSLSYEMLLFWLLYSGSAHLLLSTIKGPMQLRHNYRTVVVVNLHDVYIPSGSEPLARQISLRFWPLVSRNNFYVQRIDFHLIHFGTHNGYQRGIRRVCGCTEWQAEHEWTAEKCLSQRSRQNCHCHPLWIETSKLLVEHQSEFMVPLIELEQVTGIRVPAAVFRKLLLSHS